MVTAVILAKNEEYKITKTIESLSFCDEIIVVDDDSCDQTATIAKNSGAQVVQRSLNGDFATQRNFALSKATNDWIFFVDADEIVDRQLASEVIKVTKTADSMRFAGFFIQRVDYFLNKKLCFGETGKLFLLRLAKRGTGKWRRRVHEYWNVKGKKGYLQGKIKHYPHGNIAQFLQKIDYYSTLNAKIFYEQGKRANFFFIILFPLAKFIINYFFKLGFLDGIQGLIHAIMMSFHSFLTRGKMYFLQKNK